MTPALRAEMIATVVLAKGRRTTRGYFNAVVPRMTISGRAC